MSKAVLSNRIFMDCTPELQDAIDKELTYKIIQDYFKDF